MCVAVVQGPGPGGICLENLGQSIWVCVSGGGGRVGEVLLHARVWELFIAFIFNESEIHSSVVCPYISSQLLLIYSNIKWEKVGEGSLKDWVHSHVDSLSLWVTESQGSVLWRETINPKDSDPAASVTWLC